MLKSAFVFSALLFVSCLIWTFRPAAASDSIHWMSYKEGMSLADNLQKKRLIFFTAEWCAYCGKMDHESFKTPPVIKYINTHYVPIKVDFDRDNKTATTYNVQGLPDLWFISENGESISHRPGYIPADTLLQLLRYVSTDSYQKMSFPKFVKQCK